MILINFKNYKFGKEVLELSKLIEKTLPRAIICPPIMDVDEVAAETKLRVFAQHTDGIDSDRGTGFILARGLKKLGVRGSLLNHSEHRLDFEKIKETVELCKKEGLEVVLCCENLDEAKKFMKLKPTAIAFEDRELIGSGKSITSAMPDAVREFAQLLKGSGVKALCGAGVNSAEDVVASRELGCEGILIASAIAKVDLKKAEILLKEIARV